MTEVINNIEELIKARMKLKDEIKCIENLLTESDDKLLVVYGKTKSQHPASEVRELENLYNVNEAILLKRNLARDMINHFYQTRLKDLYQVNENIKSFLKQ